VRSTGYEVLKVNRAEVPRRGPGKIKHKDSKDTKKRDGWREIHAEGLRRGGVRSTQYGGRRKRKRTTNAPAPQGLFLWHLDAEARAEAGEGSPMNGAMETFNCRLRSPR
jgi:hypothetical protein